MTTTIIQNSGTVTYDAGAGDYEIIANDGYNNAATLVLAFGAGITPSDLQASADSNGNVYLTLGDGAAGDRIRLDGMLNAAGGTVDGQYDAPYGVGFVTFATGETLTVAQIIALADTGTGQSFGAGSFAVADGSALSSQQIIDFATGSPANAITWKNAVSGTWATANDWDPASIPGSGDTVTIDAIGSPYTVTLSGSQSVAGLTLAAATETFAVDGTIAVGGTIAVNAGVLLLDSGGVIAGGTVEVNGGTISPAGGTLSGVTYEGTLDLSAANSVLTLTGANIFTGPDGDGPGVIDLNGGSFQDSTLYALGSQTLDNATISIGNGGDGQNDLVNEGANAILTLGSHLTLSLAAGDVWLTSDDTGGDGIVNDGTIIAGVGGATLNIDPTNFTNNGSIAVSNGSDVFAGATTTSNEGTITVTTGGALEVASQLANAGFVSVDDGRLNFDNGLVNAVTGQISVTDSGALNINGGTTGPSVVAEEVNAAGGSSPLFDNQGSIAITGSGDAYIGATTASNEGTITVTAGGALEVANQLTNAGLVSVDDGQLNFDNGMTNAVTGQISVTDAGALNVNGGSQGPSGMAEEVNAADGTGPLFDNQGSIAITTGSYAYISANTASNEGTIIVTTGGAFEVANQLVNAGFVSVDDGQLYLDSGFTNIGTGQISVTDGGTIVVDGTLTAAELASITNDGGTVEITGSLEGVSITAPADLTVHIGDTASEALIVANTAQAGSPGFTAVATGAVDGDLTGASGSTGDIAPGGADTSSVNVTFSTAAAGGAEAGTAAVALTFDGSATPVTIDVPVSVTVDNYATAAIQLLGGPGVLSQTGNIYTLDLGSVPAGGIDNLDSLDLANLAPAGQPADWLTGSLELSSDAAFANSGLGAFGTLNAGQVMPFSVDLSTVNTGTFSETITLAGIDGNSSGFSLAQDATLVVTGTAVPVAVAQINTPTPIVLPDTHAVTGGTPDDVVALSITNAGTTAAAGLFAAVTTLTGGAYGSGRIGNLGAGETDDSSIVVGVDNTLAGALSGDVTIAFGSGGTGLPGDDLVQNGDFSDGLTGWTSGNAVDGAGAFGIPGFENNPDFLAFGSVGRDADTIQTLATVPGVEYQIQFWYYSGGGHPNDLNIWFGDTDVVSLTNPPNTGWTEYTADATAVSASTVLTVAGRNDPAWDALDAISVKAVDGGSYRLPSQTFSVSGNVYRLAAPVVNGNIYVHPGDPGSAVLTVTNQVPADLYSEGLEAAIVGSATGGLAGASGATGDIAAGGIDASSLVVDFSTGTVGVITSSVAVALTSDGTGVDNLGLTSLGTVDVPVTVSVDNYATAGFGQYGGNGALTQDGSVYALNLGTFGLGGNAYTYLDVINTASGPADWLTGSLSAAGDPVFTNQNLGTVGTLGAGASDDFQIGMNILAFGTYSETITLTAAGGNPSGFSEVLPTETLVVTGTVAPELMGSYVFQNTGSTLYVGPGTSFETFTLAGGTIEGGTVVDTGSGMVFQGGALSDVTYDGTLDLTPSYSSLNVVNGFTATGEDGSGPGTINLGYDSSVTFEDNQTLDNATVTVGANYASMYQYTTANYYFGHSDSTGTLMLGPNLTIDQLGAYGNLGSNGYGGGTIVNQGSFNAGAGSGYYSINPTVFDNAGLITVDSGEALYIDPATFTNEAGGTVTVGAGATLYLGSNGGVWTNDGAIVIEAGGNLFLQGVVPTAQLGSITDDGGVIHINGTLDDTGATLDVGSGNALSQVVVSNGEILGGVVKDTGQGLQGDGNYWNILNGVTYEGTLDLSTQSNDYLHLENGTTLIGAAGSGPGTVLATGYYNHLIVDGTQTLDNATIDMGNAANGWWDYLESYDGAGPAVLTLGPNLLIQQTGYNAQIDSTNGSAGSQIVNLGTIDAGVAGLGGTRFYVYGPLFDNQASISVANGVYFYDGSGVFSNEGSITIAGGSELEVQNPLVNTGVIAVGNGELRLDSGYNGLGTISIAAPGTVLLPNNATVTGIEALEANNAGTIAINGSFDDTGQTLTVSNGIVLFQNTMANNGTVVVNGTTLLLDNGLNGTGEIDLSPSGVLASGGGLLQIDGANLGGTLAGTLTSAGGSLALVGGFTIAAGITDTVTFEGAQFGWFSNGYATLSGPGTLASSGTVNVTDWGGGQVQMLLTGGMTWDNFGTVYDRDVVQLGTAAGDSATIVNEAGALFDLANGDGRVTGPGAGNASFVNLGTLQKDNGGNSYVTAPVINSGLITSTNGLLELGGGTLGGTIYGGGGAIGMVGTYNAALGTTNTVTFGGGQADFGWFSDGYATLSGPGTLATLGQANVTDWGGGQVQLLLTGGITWDNFGSIYARDVVQFGSAAGDSATIVNEAGALFDLANGDGRITVDGAGTYSFVNLGTLEKDNGGNSYVYAPVINSGLITSANGLLELRGGQLGGTIYSVSGPVGMVGTYTSAAGTTNTVSFGGGQADFGWFSDGYATLSGPGTLASSGQVNVTDWGGGQVQLLLTAGITWENYGSVYARDVVQFGTAAGDSATLVNESGALFDLASGDARLTADGAGDYNFVNNGTVLQNAGGNDYFTAPLTNTGLVETTNGFLEIGNATLGGTFEANGGNLVLVGTYTAAANTIGMVDFQSAVLGWYGDGIAVLAGPGTQASTGVVTVNDWGGNTQLELTGGIVWNNTGTVYERGRVVLGLTTGDSATIDNQAGGVIDLTSDVGQLLSNGSGTYGLTNAGLLEKTGGGGISHIQAVINETATGTIGVTSGTIAFDAGGTVSGLVNGGGAIIFDGASETVTATGTIASTSLYVTAGTLVMQGGTIGTSNLSLGSGVEAIGFGAISGLVNNGLIDASFGVLTVNGNVTGSGAFQIETGATLELGGATARNVTFDGTGATLKLDAPAGFTGQLLNFGIGDALDLADTVVTSAVISNGSIVAHLSTGGSLVFAAPGTHAGAELVFDSDGDGGTQLLIIPANVTAQPEIVTPLGPNNSIALPDAHVVTGTPNDQVTLSIENVATSAADGLDAGIAVANGSAYGTGTITSLAPGATNSTSIAIGLNNTSAGAKSGAVALSFATDGSVSGIAGAIVPQGEFDEISLASVVNTSFQNALINGGEFTSILGSTTGNQGTGIPFLVANTPNNYWSGAGGTSSITIPVGVDTSTVYTLADNIFGATGNDEYSITFTPTSGSPITEQYVGGVNTKDYNRNGGTDGSAATPGASYWFIDGAGGQGLQTVAWSLPNGFGTLASVTITQVNSQDGAIFAGLTVLQPGGTSFPGSPIHLSGNVYRYAAPSVTAPANVILHVGDNGGTATEALTVANAAPADGFSEGLDAAATGAVTGGLLGASGVTGDIGAGGSTNTLTVSFSTAAAGIVSGTAAVALTSDGAGVDSLGITNLGTVAVPVTVQVDNYATASIVELSGAAALVQNGTGYTLDLGHVTTGGAPVAVVLGVANAAAGLADLLEGSFTAGAANGIALSGFGAFSGVAAGGTQGGMDIVLDTGSAGAFTQQITLAGTGYNASGYAGVLVPEVITVIGTVAAYAVPMLNMGSIILANQRQRDTPATAALSLSNVAIPPSEALDVAVTGSAGGAFAAGSIQLLGAGDTDATSIQAGISTGVAGHVSGSVVLTETSDGTGIDGAGTTLLNTASVSVTGNVYREGSASFGMIAPLVLHPGQAANLSIAVTNSAAADGYSENLIANTTSVTSGIVSLVGGTGDIAAAGAGTLQASVTAGAAGLLSGAVTLDLISDGTGIDGLGTVDLGPRTVAVTGTIYNYATAGVTVKNAGTLTGSGNSYVLHLGTLAQGGVGATAVLDLTNIATGPADYLSGTAMVSGGISGFVNGGFGAVGTLSAGQISNQINIALHTGTLGVYTETATFTPISSDSAGATSLAPITITVTGTVVAPSGAVYNLTTGSDTVNGNGSANTIVATGGALTAGDIINAGSGSSNLLSLQGAGSFDLGLPATLTGISTVWAKEGQSSATVNGVTYASTLQNVTLRAAENNVTVNVQPATPNPANPAAPAITINGAANNDVINLGYGNDTVTPGVGETVNGGSGNATVMVTAATISDAINGGSGTTKLWFTGGGASVLGANLTNLTSVYLAPASTAWNITATTTPGLVIQDGDTVNIDRLVANGAIQVLTGGGAGKLTMQGAFDTTFQDSAALFNGDTLGFAAGDLIDITGLTYAASGAGRTTIGFAENSQNTGGSLTVLTGSVQRTVMTLTGGIFNQGSFTVGSDNAGGTLIRYHS